EPATEQEGRLGLQAVDQPPQRGRDRLLMQRQRRRRLAAAELDHVRALGGSEAQRPRERLQHGHPGLHVAPPLPPRVPGGAHARQRRQLLAPEPRRAAAATAREADVVGLQALAARAQEASQLLAPERDIVDGGWCQYQDKSFSCTWLRLAREYHP